MTAPKPTNGRQRKPPSPSSSMGGGGGGGAGTNVRVVGRIRPLAAYEKEKGCQEAVTCIPCDFLRDSPPTSPQVIGARSKHEEQKRWFELDAVFDGSSTQKDVYVQSGAQRAVQQDLFKGYNCTILAYGQTGAGKTFTMGTAASTASGAVCGDYSQQQQQGSGGGEMISDTDGVIPRACVDLFRMIASKCDNNAVVELSYLEVYNEEIRDLLAATDSNTENDHHAQQQLLRIRETLDGEVYVRGLQSRRVQNSDDIGTAMAEASERRVVASTKMNATSSRSHAICILRIKGVLDDATKFQSKLTLVDLAGSERIKKTAAGAKRAKEGININKGLFVLGQVVSALSSDAQRSKFKRKPPYRDSKLTRLLQDSLGGNSRTIMVACVSPADFNLEESVNTLRYATTARNIKNTATRNVMQPISPEEVAKLRRENQLLKQEVTELQATIEKMQAAEEILSAEDLERSVRFMNEQFSTTTTTNGHQEQQDDDHHHRHHNVPGMTPIPEDASSPIASSSNIHNHHNSNNNSNNNGRKKKTYEELERQVAQLTIALDQAKHQVRSSLHESAIQLPAVKMQLAIVEEELQESKMIADEAEDLQKQVQELTADAHAARVAADQLSKMVQDGGTNSNNEEQQQVFSPFDKKHMVLWLILLAAWVWPLAPVLIHVFLVALLYYNFGHLAGFGYSTSNARNNTNERAMILSGSSKVN